MIKLTNILSEVLNRFQIEAILINDSSFSISDILNQIRGLKIKHLIKNLLDEFKG